MYSFAILAWEMLTCRIPFEDSTPVEAALAVARECRRPEIPAGTHGTIASLIDVCWQQNALTRLAMSDVLARLEELALAIAPARPDSGGTSRPSITR